ncbi:histidine kinase N-terminal 7TM domain-containing diguanylate cyclase [Cryptosporangium arvum]|uniref:Diguanylate cyclase (GGDEF) domain-containing protein n=1 Tax=Cryptosporangium arvum DSM 44712 TaxID=927661 RepID=A0A010ZVS1_9ACTN|nr:diguanylate cyclase [Cryptosporangium arvum]EXG82754.1 diguanylate cyclase (GGDEF) domain-containing protein [Cryptosporangium arvum DSM 44712]
MWPQLMTLAYGVVASIGAHTVVAAWHGRAHRVGVRPLAGLAGGIALLAVVACASTLTGDATTLRVLATIGILPQGGLIASYAVLVWTIGNPSWSTRWRIALLSIEPVVATALAATDGWHHLFFGPVAMNPLGVWVVQVGPLYWLHLMFLYFLTIWSTLHFGLADPAAPQKKKRKLGWMTAIALPPIVVNFLALEVVPLGVELTLIGMASTVVVLRVVLDRQSFDLRPVAREQVIDELSDYFCLVDRAGYVRDFNRAARQLLDGLDPELTRRHDIRIEEFGLGVQPDPERDTTTLVEDASGLGIDLEIRLIVLRDRAGACVGWALLSRDVTASHRQQRSLRRQLETIEALRAELAEQAVRDPLTGLHNRRYLADVLAVRSGGAAGERNCVALLDIDHFKRVNDTWGHAVGDDVLVGVARVLADGQPPGVVVARNGGEEFVLVFPGITADEGRARVEALRARVAARTFAVDGGVLRVTFSAGVAAADGRFDADALLEGADRALYRAKDNGRNRTETASADEFAPAM